MLLSLQTIKLLLNWSHRACSQYFLRSMLLFMRWRTEHIFFWVDAPGVTAATFAAKLTVDNMAVLTKLIKSGSIVVHWGINCRTEEEENICRCMVQLCSPTLHMWNKQAWSVTFFFYCQHQNKPFNYCKHFKKYQFFLISNFTWNSADFHWFCWH